MIDQKNKISEMQEDPLGNDPKPQQPQPQPAQPQPAQPQVAPPATLPPQPAAQPAKPQGNFPTPPPTPQKQPIQPQVQQAAPQPVTPAPQPAPQPASPADQLLPYDEPVKGPFRIIVPPLIIILVSVSIGYGIYTSLVVNNEAKIIPNTELYNQPGIPQSTSDTPPLDPNKVNR